MDLLADVHHDASCQRLAGLSHQTDGEISELYGPVLQEREAQPDNHTDVL